MKRDVYQALNICRNPAAVLDTVRFNTPGAMTRRVSPGECRVRGLRISRSDDGSWLHRVEASLPMLLWGYNGRLLSTQDEQDGALARLEQSIGTFARIAPASTWTPSRLDLVWQWQVPKAAAFIDGLSGCRYPAIKSPPIHQAGRCLTYRGAGSRLMIQIYNKSVKSRVPGEVVRIEVRLVQNQLRKLRGADWRDFGQLYRVYRELLIAFPVVTFPNGKGGFPEAIGSTIPSEYHERLLASLKGSARTIRDYRRRIKIASTSKLLKKLYTLCTTGDAAHREPAWLNNPENAASMQIPATEPPNGVRYETSAEKIWRMHRALHENGFTSFPEN